MHSGLASFHFARRYFENRCFFLFLRLLRCFSSAGSLPYVMNWRMDDWRLSSRVSPFRYLRINGYLLLPEAFRSLSRLSSALSAKASTLRSFQLNQLYHSYSVMNVGSGFVCVHKHSWFLSRMSCIFCVIKILVFFYMRFSRYNIK